ncbi:MAG: NAD(P)-dependent oxidoreductase [Tetrasphaera sp.]
MSRIAFAGTGAMGAGMIRRLLDQGHEVAVWNRTPAKALPLIEAGATLAETITDLGRAEPDIAFVSVADGESVAGIVLGEHGLARTLPAGTALCNLSTVDPQWSRTFAEQVGEDGILLLETTVLGNNAHAASGELRIYVSGPESGLDRVRPILQDLGKQVSFVGDYGAATTLKIALNLLMGVQMQALAEAVVIAERSGLPTETILGAIAESGYCSPVMRFKTRAIAAQAWERADFRLTLMRKDLALAEDLGAGAGVPTPAVTASRLVLDEATASGRGALDCSAVVDYVREVSERLRLAG